MIFRAQGYRKLHASTIKVPDVARSEGAGDKYFYEWVYKWWRHKNDFSEIMGFIAEQPI